MVFTATSLGKKSKDPIGDIRDKVEKYGFKAIPDYQSGKTTHVVAIKRNIPQVLSALVDGKHVVTSDFVDKLVEAAQPDGVLEQDVSTWPSESEFLPPAGKEPVPRPSELLLPNRARQDVFAGYTFVFCDSKQHESLLGPITCGSGKALLYSSFAWGETSPQDFATFVKNTAGEKDAEELDQDAGSKGVVVVRLGDSKDPQDEAWRESFIEQSDLLLGQRSILQNEFLDAIIMCSAKDLKKPLEEDIEIGSTAPARKYSHHTKDTRMDRLIDHAASASTIAQARHPQNHSTLREEAGVRATMDQRADQQPVAPASRRSRRPVIKTRSNVFDDFDPSQISRPVDGDDDEQASSTQRPGTSQNARGRSNTQTVANRGQQDQPMNDIAEEEEEDEFENLLPAAAAMKRRRQEMSVDERRTATETAEIAKPARKKQRKDSPEIDVREATRKRVEEAEAAAQGDEETIKEMMQGMDIDSIRGLATIEEMEVRDRPSERRGRPAQGDTENNNDRWKPEWNGRKNFKKFRRKGANGEDAPLRGHKVIIPLQEAVRRGYGVGDEYWHDSSKSRSKSQSQRQGDAVSQVPPADNNAEDDNDDDDDDSEGDGIRFRSRRSTQPRSNGGSTQASDTQTKGTTRTASKRSAPDEGREATKRTRTAKSTAPVITVSDSDDDDGLRFKFKGKKR